MNKCHYFSVSDLQMKKILLTLKVMLVTPLHIMGYNKNLNSENYKKLGDNTFFW